MESRRIEALAKIDDAADSATIATALVTLGENEKPSTPGITMVKRWEFRITDAALIPREFLEPDMVKIRKVISAGVSIPGIFSEQVESVSSVSR